MIEFEIDFRDQSALDRYGRAGWGPAEAFGAWMVGKTSTLILPPPPRSDAPMVMQALIGPMLIPGAVERQRIRILVNGHVVTAAHISQLHHVNCPIPLDATQGAAQIEIVIEHPDAARQSDYGAGQDVRELAGSVWSLTLLADSPLPMEPMPQTDAPVFHTRARGNLGNRMVQHMVALAVQAQAPRTRLTGVDLPEWGIAGAADDGIWADWVERDEQGLDIGQIGWMLREGRARRVVSRAYGQRMSHFLPRATYQDIFRADVPHIRGYDDSHLVINIRTGDVMSGAFADYVLLPVAFYRDLVNQTGLTPVFMGQTEPNAYTDALRAEFPDALFIGSLGVIEDFELIRRSANVVVAISTFSWLAAWLSDAQQIFLPVNGLFNPMQAPGVDLLPMHDPRYRFFLFPVNHASTDFAAAHAAIAWQWREISGWDAGELRRSIPFPPTPPLHATPLIEWEPSPVDVAAQLPDGPAVPEDLTTVLAAAEKAARAGYLLDALHHLRQMPLIDFTRLLWSMPRGDFPSLSQILPRMPEPAIQEGYTGRSGDELVLVSVELCRILEIHFRQITGRDLRHGRVLDFGCGWGRMLRVLWYLTDPDLCCGVDASPQAIALCRQTGMRGSFAISDAMATELPMDERRFDLILAYSVFTHTPPAITRNALASLRRHVRPNGLLALTIRPAEFWPATGLPEAVGLLESHRTTGIAYRSLGILSDDGAELYGDMSISVPHLASLAPDWEVMGFERGMDPLETIVFLTPR